MQVINVSLAKAKLAEKQQSSLTFQSKQNSLIFPVTVINKLSIKNRQCTADSHLKTEGKHPFSTAVLH